MYYIILKFVCINVRSLVCFLFHGTRTVSVCEHTVSSLAFKTEYLALSLLYCVREKNE